jgi:hypothetical protein
LWSGVTVSSNSKDAEDQWRKERAIEHLGELVARRFESYAAVMKTLGAVRDVPDPEGHHYEGLRQDRSSLLTVADELIGHLYGAPGLYMRYETRTQLLRAYLACHRFQKPKAEVDELVYQFWEARRLLREDLQISDEEERKTELEKISGEVIVPLSAPGGKVDS